MSITISIVGNTNHELMAFAINKTRLAIRHEKIVVFSDKPLNLQCDYRFVELTNPKNKLLLDADSTFGMADYCNLVVKKINNFIDTDYLINIQYDGFAVNNFHWSNRFLNYDFIGPLISTNHGPVTKGLLDAGTSISKNFAHLKDWRTGGGGFSLKSKKFLEICNKYDEIQSFMDTNKDGVIWFCDDIALSYFYQPFLKSKGMKYGSLSDSLNFAVEIATGYDHSLGFHGWYNIGLFLSEEEIFYYMEHLQRNLHPSEIGMFLGFLLKTNKYKAFQHFHQKYKHLWETDDKKN